MAQVTYRVREGYRLKGDAQAIAEWIEKLKRRHRSKGNPEGFTTPEEVFEAAKDPDTPAHNNFTWDRDKAALRRNLDEALYLIRSYEVVVLKRDSKPLVISPANVRIKRPNEKSEFVSSTFAMSHEDTRAAVLLEAATLLAGIKRRLDGLEGISSATIGLLDQAIKAMEAEVKAKRRKRRKPAA